MRLMSASGTGSGLRRRMARVVWMISKSSVPATMKIPLLLRIGFPTEKYHTRNDAERPERQMGGGVALFGPPVSERWGRLALAPEWVSNRRKGLALRTCLTTLVGTLRARRGTSGIKWEVRRRANMQ